jgi:hypothetical protein
VKSVSATSARETQIPLSWSKIASRYSTGVHAASWMAEIAARALGSARTVIDTCAPALVAAATVG